MLFPHPSASKVASGFMLLTRCLPRVSNGLANTTATLGSFYWLGFETTGLSPDKKRLAWLGAQRQRARNPISGGAPVDHIVEVESTQEDESMRTGRLIGVAVSRLVRLLRIQMETRPAAMSRLLPGSGICWSVPTLIPPLSAVALAATTSSPPEFVICAHP